MNEKQEISHVVQRTALATGRTIAVKVFDDRKDARSFAARERRRQAEARTRKYSYRVDSCKKG